MVSSEIRETVFIAISAILLSSLLGFVSFLMMMRSEFATVRTAEVASSQTMADYREFSKYNGATLFGEDVVAAVRDYYNSDITIRVNTSAGAKTYNRVEYRKSTDSVDVAELQRIFPVTGMYKAILVYGQVDLNTVTQDHPTVQMGVDSNVSAVVFFYTGERQG